MVEHIVLWKFTDNATKEQKEEMMRQLLTLKDRCRGITAATVGWNFSERSQGYEVGFRVTFEDKGALEEYLPSDPHQEVVAKYVGPISAEVCVVDYEF